MAKKAQIDATTSVEPTRTPNSCPPSHSTAREISRLIARVPWGESSEDEVGKLLLKLSTQRADPDGQLPGQAVINIGHAEDRPTGRR